jgi:hypothetical protein
LFEKVLFGSLEISLWDILYMYIPFKDMSMGYTLVARVGAAEAQLVTL